MPSSSSLQQKEEEDDDGIDVIVVCFATKKKTKIPQATCVAYHLIFCAPRRQHQKKDEGGT